MCHGGDCCQAVIFRTLSNEHCFFFNTYSKNFFLKDMWICFWKNMATTTQVEVLAGAPQPNVVLQMVKSSILKGPNLCWKAFTAACWRKSLLRENFEWLVIRNHFGNYFTEIYHRVAASTLGKCIGPTIVCYNVIQKLFSSARLGFIGDSVPPWNLWCRWIQGRTWRCSHVDLQSQGLPWCWCYLEQSH